MEDEARVRLQYALAMFVDHHVRAVNIYQFTPTSLRGTDGKQAIEEEGTGPGRGFFADVSLVSTISSL